MDVEILQRYTFSENSSDYASRLYILAHAPPSTAGLARNSHQTSCYVYSVWLPPYALNGVFTTNTMAGPDFVKSQSSSVSVTSDSPPSPDTIDCTKLRLTIFFQHTVWSNPIAQLLRSPAFVRSRKSHVEQVRTCLLEFEDKFWLR